MQPNKLRPKNLPEHILIMKRTCGYCGKTVSTYDKEHVFPKCLYPKSKKISKTQRLTIPACNDCNNSWADDEAHFRNVLMLAGNPNPPRQELWNGPVNRSFDQVDGLRRINDLFDLLKPVKIEGKDRHMIYPAEDLRVLRIIQKIVRGLCYHHQVLSPVSDRQVWPDVLRYQIPPGFLDTMEYHHRERDIVEYWYQVYDDDEIHSAWIISFYERIGFIGRVSRTAWKSLDSKK